MQCLRFGAPGTKWTLFAPKGLSKSSMTAIVRTYNEDGFVIAADGRKSNPEDHSVISDDAQKIFKLNSSGNSLAVCFCGTVGVTDDLDEEVVWDVCREVLQSADQLAKRRTSTLAGLATRICRPVNKLLAEVRNTGRISKYPELEPVVLGERGNTIARVLIEGYHNGIPARVSVRFFHENQRLLEPEVVTVDLSPGQNWIFGPKGIADIFFNRDDTRLLVYRSAEGSGSIRSAIKWSTGFIQACSDSQALEIDPNCYAVGGHVHIATITPQEGFCWAREPVTVTAP